MKGKIHKSIDDNNLQEYSKGIILDLGFAICAFVSKKIVNIPNVRACKYF